MTNPLILTLENKHPSLHFILQSKENPKIIRGSIQQNILGELQKNWLTFYQQLYYDHNSRKIANNHLENKIISPLKSRLKSKQKQKTFLVNPEINPAISNLKKAAEQFNTLQNYPEFKPLLETIKQQHQDTLLIKTDNPYWWSFPWQIVFPQLKTGLVYPNSRPIKRPKITKQKPRVLAILGDNRNIKAEEDLKIWQQLEDEKKINLEVLNKPERGELYQKIWERKGWDIIYFCGHSMTLEGGKIGEISFNENGEKISIEQLKEALKAAVNLGLKLAIFNSCQGVGLAWQLADILIPQVIVMLESIDDTIARQFIDDFLSSYSQGEKNLYQSVWEARDNLQQTLEKDIYPCASWLPIICQNAYDAPLSWQDFTGGKVKSNWYATCQSMQALNKQNNLVNNPIVNEKPIGFELAEIFVPLGLVERREVKKLQSEKETPTSDDSPEEVQEITKTYEQDEFFTEVLAKGDSPKSKGQIILIIGDPGAGKTTTLQKISDWIFDSQQNLSSTSQQEEKTKPNVAILISLASLQGQSIREYLENQWLAQAETFGIPEFDASPASSKEMAINQLFSEYQVWLLLDGADESGISLSAINSQLSDYLASARVIITCRVNFWEAQKAGIEDKFDFYRNLEFNPDQKKLFIQRWFLSKPELGQDLLNNLQKSTNQRINELVNNPLRLTLLCAIWHQLQGKLPETTAQLYREFVQEIYTWKKRIFKPTSREKEQLNQKLGELALLGIEENYGFRLPEGVVKKVLGESLKPVLDLGWLNQIDRDKNQLPIYSFYHPSFQEYFAADVIENGNYFLPFDHENKPVEGEKYRIFAQKWKQVFLFWMGMETKAREDLLGILLDFDSGIVINDSQRNLDFYSIRSVLLALEALEEFKSASSDFVETTINKIRSWWDYPSQSLKRSIINSLSQIGSEKAESVLIEALSHSDLGVRRNGAEALGKIGSQKAVPALSKALSDTEKYVRISAVRALGEIGLEKALPALSKALSDSDLGVRRYAISALGEISSEKAMPALIQALSDSDLEVRISAVGYLRKIGTEKAVPALEMALSDSDLEVRRVAAEALGKIGTEKAVPALIKALSDSDSWVLRAVNFLEQIGSETAVPAFIQALFDSDLEVRRVAAEALGEIASETAVPTLIKALSDSDLEVRRYAAKALEKIASETAVPALIDALFDSDLEVRRYAVYALEKIASETAVSALIDALFDSDLEVQRSAIYALGKIGSQKVVPALIEALSHSDSYVRRMAVEALGKIGSETAEPALKMALSDSDLEVQRSAIYALGKIGSETAVSALIEALSHSDSDVRRAAVSTLEKIGSETAEPALKIALSHSDKQVRKYAVNALGRIGSQKAVPALIETLSDSDSNVRRDAAEALGKIGSETTLSALIDALSDSDLWVRRKVASALGKIGSQKAESVLIEALSYYDSDVRLIIRLF